MGHDHQRPRLAQRRRGCHLCHHLTKRPVRLHRCKFIGYRHTHLGPCHWPSCRMVERTKLAPAAGCNHRVHPALTRAYGMVADGFGGCKRLPPFGRFVDDRWRMISVTMFSRVAAFLPYVTRMGPYMQHEFQIQYTGYTSIMREPCILLLQVLAFLPLRTTCLSVLFRGFILIVKGSLYRLAHIVLQTEDPIHGGKSSFLRRLDCDRRRHDNALAAWAALTAVRLVLPLVWLVTAAPPVAVVRHYFGGGCADDLLVAVGAVPTSSGTHSELGWGVATAAEVGRH
ncbi:hypothetical protein JOM56_000723 [Amanita muscaria]